MMKLRQVMQRSKGQGMAEYGLILALVAIVAIIAVAALGPELSAVFNEIVSGLQQR
jgi:pilus assembly protein Flp/PilA